MHAGARHPEGGHMVGHPSEVAAEAVAAALSSDRPGGPGVVAGGGVSLSQEGGQQEHGGPGGDAGDGKKYL